MPQVPPIGGVAQVNHLEAKLAQAEANSRGVASDGERIANAVERAGLELALAISRLGIAVNAAAQR